MPGRDRRGGYWLRSHHLQEAESCFFIRAYLAVTLESYRISEPDDLGARFTDRFPDHNCMNFRSAKRGENPTQALDVVGSRARHEAGR
jgi:hypothetical protein